MSVIVERICRAGIAMCFYLFFMVPVASAQVIAMDGGSRGVVGKCVVLDAGHGGPDSGARGVDALYEKHVTLAVARYLKTYLQQSGAIVIMTRSGDHDLATESDRAIRQRHRGDLKGRLSVSKQINADAFVSIHCNAVPSPTWRGAQTLYLKGNDEGKALASLMQASFRMLLLPTDRQIQSNTSLFLLKRIHGPTVLAEIGFVTNPEEAAALRTVRYQREVAFAMYCALQAYFSRESTDSSAAPS